MKHNEPPIPLRGIVGLPRWLMVTGVVLSTACMAVGVGLAIYALGWLEGGAMGGWLGGAFGCVVGGAGGLFGTLCDARRRFPATVYLQHLQNDRPSPFYRRTFWPAVALLVTGLVVGAVWSHRLVWHGIVQFSAILAFVGGSIEVARRHNTRQARAVFALYADGALDAEDTAAIDDARAKSSKFDADVRGYLAMSERVRALGGEGRE
ncbi:MAG: hypothetical protein AAF628_27035 [Planctomycetota bacterium]